MFVNRIAIILQCWKLSQNACEHRFAKIAYIHFGDRENIMNYNLPKEFVINEIFKTIHDLGKFVHELNVAAIAVRVGALL